MALEVLEFLNQQSKFKNKVAAFDVIKRLLNFILIPVTTHKDLLLAVKSEFSDFEDGIQYFTSLNVEGLDYIITRNKKDFKHSAIEVVTAEEFINLFK